MAITASQILYERARAQDSEAGTLSGDYIRDAIAGDLFKKIPSSVFLNGGQILKKAFIRFDSASLVSEAHLFPSAYTSVPTGVIATLQGGADGQNSVASATGPMVVGTVNADVTNGAAFVDVALARSEPMSFFSGWNDGDTLAALVAGSPVYLQTDSATPPSNQGSGIWRFTLAAAWSGVTVPAGTLISQRLTATNLQPSVVEQPGYASITLDETQVVVDPSGAVHDTLTLTFSSATEYSVTSAEFGLLASGDTAIDVQVVNPDTGKPMVTIPAAAWSGNAANNDSVLLDITPSALAFFVCLDVAAGTSEQSVRFDLTHDVLG